MPSRYASRGGVILPPPPTHPAPPPPTVRMFCFYYSILSQLGLHTLMELLLRTDVHVNEIQNLFAVDLVPFFQ